LFVAGATARTDTELTGVNKTTAAYYFHRLSLLFFHSCEHLELFDGEVEADESYLEGGRKGKRSRGAAGKVVVFGLLKRNGKVYTVTVANISDYPAADYPGADKAGQRSLYRLPQYPNVLDVSEFSRLHINYRTHFAGRQNHINGIENF